MSNQIPTLSILTIVTSQIRDEYATAWADASAPLHIHSRASHDAAKALAVKAFDSLIVMIRKEATVDALRAAAVDVEQEPPVGLASRQIHDWLQRRAERIA